MEALRHYLCASPTIVGTERVRCQLAVARIVDTPGVMEAYDALGADAFFYYAHFAPEKAKMPAGEKMGAATRVTMKERVKLIKGVQRGLGRALNKMEMLEYVKAENDAYAAYFALRTGPCRR